jgi:hypothetical protein
VSDNGDKPKRRSFPKRIPLLMVGSDGELYACAPTHLLPEGILRNKHTMAAVRLTHRERGLAIEALQVGVIEASKVLNKIRGSKLDS